MKTRRKRKDHVHHTDQAEKNPEIAVALPHTPSGSQKGYRGETKGSSTTELIEICKLKMIQNQARLDEEEETRAWECEEEKKWLQ